MDLDSFRHRQFWCPRDNRVVDCPGPCPDGRHHVPLPWCQACEGIGKINVYIEKRPVDEDHPSRRWMPEGTLVYTLLGDSCPECYGKAAVRPIFN